MAYRIGHGIPGRASGPIAKSFREGPVMHEFGGIRLRSILGIEVFIDWSLLLIVAVLTLGLAMGYFAAWHPDWSALLTWSMAFVVALALVVSILVHELAHALVGRRRGIDVRRIYLFVFGGTAQMEREPTHRRAEFAMAIVGPLTSLALGVLCLWLASVLAGPIAFDPRAPEQTMAVFSPCCSGSGRSICCSACSTSFRAFRSTADACCAR